MRCHDCLREISGGPEQAKRIEIRAVTVFADLPGEPVPTPYGVGMKAGSLKDGEKWPLISAEHSRCYHARTRAVARQLVKEAERAADPGFVEHEERDWRDPVTADLEVLLRDESHGGPG